MFKFGLSKPNNGRVSDRDVGNVDNLVGNLADLKIEAEQVDQRQTSTNTRPVATNDNAREQSDSGQNKRGTVRFRSQGGVTERLISTPDISKPMMSFDFSGYDSMVPASLLRSLENTLTDFQSRIGVLEGKSVDKLPLKKDEDWMPLTYMDIGFYSNDNSYSKYFESKLVDPKMTDQQINCYLQQYCGGPAQLSTRLSLFLAGVDNSDTFHFHPDREFKEQEKANRFLCVLITTLPTVGYVLEVHQKTLVIRITRPKQ